VLTLGHEHGKPPGPVASVPTLQLKTAPLSSREIDYPEIRAAHEASRLDAPAEVRDWRAAAADAAHAALATSGESHPLRPLAAGGLPNEPLDSVIRRRGSTRRFSHRPIRFEELSTLLRVAAGALRSDFGDSPNLMYLIVNAVDGLRPGAYVYHSRAEEMEMLRDGDFRREAGFLGLGQALPADASVALFFCCDLDPVLRRLGNRGYRVAQLDAAVRGGRLYLASYALGLGATGLTFFDDDVIEFFSPHANGKSVMFLIAVGHRAAPRRPR
jgi:nitroreductase